MDNFVPETDAIENFLDEQDSSTADRLAAMNIHDEDDTDDDTPNNDNPMVASFAEDVEIDDYIPGQQDFLVTFFPVFLRWLRVKADIRAKNFPFYTKTTPELSWVSNNG